MSNTSPNVPFGTGGEYVFNFCIFGQQQFRVIDTDLNSSVGAGRFPNALPNAKLLNVVCKLKTNILN